MRLRCARFCEIPRTPVGGEKIEPAGKEPQKMNCFINAVKQNTRFFRLLYGFDHGKERKGALRKLRRFHGRKPDLSTVAFLVNTWGRMCFEYTETIRGGVRTTMRILPEGATREAFAALAMSPYRNSSKRLWRWPNVFSFSAANGMWKGRIIPEVEEHLEATRIQGSAHLRTHSFLFENTGDAPTKGKNGRRNRQGRTETGGDAPKDLKTETPNAGGETGYPIGKRLRVVEFEASNQHFPRDNKSGKPLCWNFNSNSGCATKGGNARLDYTGG